MIKQCQNIDKSFNKYTRFATEFDTKYLMLTPNSQDKFLANIVRATIQDMYEAAEAEQRQIDLDNEMNGCYNDDFYRRTMNQLEKDFD